ncbi:MAG TPA: sulfotransferase [Rhizomicrobium sp.]|nr:sulfotransferase [Rhizomicrobium sp.]
MTGEKVALEALGGIILIGMGTALSVRFLDAAERVLGIRRSAIALILPLFGPAGLAAIEGLSPHHSIRTVSIGFSLANAATMLVAGAWGVRLGIKSIDARVFQYFLFAIPIPIVSVLALADSMITHFEAISLIVIYVAFVAAAWWFDRREGLPPRTEKSALFPALVMLAMGCAITLGGSAILISCARTAVRGWHEPPFGSSFAALGMVAQILAFVWISMRQNRSDLAVAGVVGSFAFNSTVTLGVFGLTSHHHQQIDPSAFAIAALATLMVPAVLFPLAFKQTKRSPADAERRASDAHMDNIFAWRNLKRDLSNFQLLHHRNVDGNLVTGMNSGTHWVTVMLATAIAEQHGLTLPKYFSFDAAGDIVGIPSKIVRRPGIPAIALYHNHPAAIVAWPIVRRLLPYPKQVVLVRDIREVLISAYVKWMPNGEVPFSDFVRGDPTNQRGYLCDVWWYLSYLNRWGDVKASAPGDTLVVRYEDMVEDPALWLRRIGDHFGLHLADHAIAAALTLRDKDAAQARRDPKDTEAFIADPAAKARVRFTDEDMRELRNILARHLRYDYGYDYGLSGVPLIPIHASGRKAQHAMPSGAPVPQT